MANKVDPSEPFTKQKKKLNWLQKLILKIK